MTGVTVSSSATNQRDALLDQLEQVWRSFDQFFASMSAEDWSKKHGNDWAFADLPYHLSYFDRDVVANPLAKGASLPVPERWLMQSENEIDAWNARMFAMRPKGQPIEQEIELARASRQLVRDGIRALSDADLGKPCWSPFAGWLTVADALDTCIAHTFSHHAEARLRLKRPAPDPLTAPARTTLTFYTRLLSGMLSREAAAGRQFNAVMDFPNVGAWTIKVADGTARVIEGRVDPADLVMIQTPETFIGVMTKAQNPMLALVTRKLKVKGVAKMGTFQKLFPNPTPDTLVFPRTRLDADPPSISPN